MYDELVKRLREPCQYENCVLCQQAADAIEDLIAKLNHADDQIERLVEAAEERRWIHVTERLPEAGERLLCYCRANIYEVMKMRTNGDWVHDINHIYMHSFVTLWMPLPEPPKEG